ncbi:RNA polymerase sigma-32 factor [Rhodobium orientis]|uniref:RNA polymerase factor sigma-32 n=1 Tax=Rhodobium orientis TaxID=34017 RepID=A0A327JDG6_9HYPH|nr:RNA polymerase factor sigma-32 [Rhodobium orientis]MBB4305660.1 RNA polymerase sigma-32 factor [Rhodobium orientis]MBK5950936.1 RNA polymerase factor sigma-32 [Rhodobium orientis]RAI23878.1 RNA polymerase factor sigma-32 [Rhodobium orientis]
MRKPVSPRRQFVKAAMAAPYLTKEEEQSLAVRWRDDKDQQALHKLTSAHMRLVIALAAKFRHFGLSMNDLIQEGHVGLLEAAARFEPERDVRFSTYATWWIRASIQDHVLRNWSIVRGGTSSAQKALFFNLRRLRAKIAVNGQSQPDSNAYDEIALAVGVSRKDVELMDSRLSGPDMSLNAPVIESDGNSADRQDFLVSDGPLPDETVGSEIDKERRSQWLGSALTVLSERELKIVRERRLTEEGATLESLGAKLGISKERVRQIEARALEKLRAALLQENADPAAFVG